MAQYLVVLGGMPLEVTDLEIRDLSPPKKPDPDAGKQKYEPTERETTALDRYRAQKATAPAAPRMKVTNDKKAATIAPDHPDQPLACALLKEALGTVSDDFMNGLLSQLAQMPVRTAAKPTNTRLILCCQWSQASSLRISLRQCWRHRWPLFTGPP
jgi:hypothetical protein